jgi:hypothetical protein
VLVVSVDGSWWDWLWVKSPEPPVHVCITPISHAFSINETIDAWETYLVTEKIVLNEDSSKAVGTFIRFVHSAYTPCLRNKMGMKFKSEEWGPYMKNLVKSSTFIMSMPGFISLLILIIQAVRSQCCGEKGSHRPRGSHRLLRRRTNAATPRLMQ